MVHELKEVQIMRGAVEDILIKGLDRDRTAPKLSEFRDGNLHFQYDLFNLDFLGGVAYKRK
jgi:hypothetical protein